MHIVTSFVTNLLPNMVKDSPNLMTYLVTNFVNGKPKIEGITKFVDKYSEKFGESPIKVIQ